ncbi:MAG: PAS domain S-box protein [Solirubrobacterales bacterium]|nr:PAS domain S-box protein [Solirubrobacterales bacterium]
MDRSRELAREAVAWLALRALPHLSVVVFDGELRVVLGAGRVPAGDIDACGIEGRLLSHSFAADHWAKLEPLVRAALEGRSGSVEIDAARGEHWYQVDVETLRDEQGVIVGGVCFWHEVTEHKRLISELEQRERLMALAHDAIIVRDPATSAVTYWNREASEIYGYTASEALGRVTHALLATEFPDSREAVEEALRSVGRWEGELVHTCSDRRQILVSSRQALVRNDRGDSLAVIELNSDITERKRAERELRVAEQRFRGMLESAPDAIVIVDQSGTIVLVNARAEELFGYSREELTGKPVEILLPKALSRRHLTHREGFIAEPRARAMGEGLDLRARRKNGTEFAAEISLSPVRTESGLLISAGIRDVSKQVLRQLEQALVPRMEISDRWQLAWRYRPSLNTMLLGGDFIGVCEPPNESLSLLIGDVTGHGPAAAGTGAMLRAAWLGAAQAGVPMEALPPLLHRLLVNQADRSTSQLATVCLAEIDVRSGELRLIRAGHDSPVLITPSGVAPIECAHGPALGLNGVSRWPLARVALRSDAAIMLFTDGLTERRPALRAARLQYSDLLPRIDATEMLRTPPGHAIDTLLARLFPQGTEQLEDDLAVILVNLKHSAVVAETFERPSIARSA